MPSERIVAWARVDAAVQEVVLRTGSLTRRAIESMITLALQSGGAGLSPQDRAAIVAFRTRTDEAEAAPTASNWGPRPTGFGVVIAVGVAPSPADAGPLDLRVDRPDNGTLLGTTTFTGADGEGWPVPWAAVATPTGGGLSTLSGWGVLTTGAGGGAADYVAARFGDRPTTDADVVFTVRRDTAGATARVVLRSSEASLTPGSAVVVDFGASAVTISTVNAGTATQAGTAAKTFTVGTEYRVRVQVTGWTARVRVWAVGATEPTTWDLAATVSGGPAAGYVGLATVPTASGAQKAAFDDVHVTTSASGGYGLNYGNAYGG